MAEAIVPDSSMLSDSATQKTELVHDSQDDKLAKERFEVELEFVQCLANPWYINFLAQQGYFDQPAFVNYLKYLKYWQKPEYARFVVYPNALAFLDLLQYQSFRDEMKKVEKATWVHEQQYFHWRWPNVRQEGEDGK
ncbi:suppressor of hpr1 [Linderina macrospora]|uniref:Suppressor of hpr1 n=1 Tax=Linderina macrospora TaxID=4868 RepID=A0ACC1J6V1_9FUNG|nr:suppressor of hpr1 [Linderina macrospora]